MYHGDEEKEVNRETNDGKGGKGRRRRGIGEGVCLSSLSLGSSIMRILAGVININPQSTKVLIRCQSELS